MDRLAPHSVEAEESVLGSILVDDRVMPELMSILAPRDFFRDRNQFVYEACLKIAQRQLSGHVQDCINVVTVTWELENHLIKFEDDRPPSNRLEAIGGPAYLANLVAQVPTALHFRHYADIVKQESRKRRLIQWNGKMAQRAYEAPSIDEFKTEMFNELVQIMDTRPDGEFETLADLVANHHREIEQFREDPTTQRGLLTGFRGVDNLTNGLFPDDLTILAARPGMGKTMWLLNMARNIARQGRPVIFFSLEMSKMPLFNRLVYSEAGLDGSSVVRRGWETNELTRRDLAQAALTALPLAIDDTRGLDTMSIRLRASKMKARWPALGAIVIDYLDLITDTVRGDSEVMRREQIVQRLRELSGQLKVPVVLACQLSRATEARTNHRPTMGDLRMSGGIEQIADNVLFLYRDFYYNEEADPFSLEVLVAKQRNGPVGTTTLHYNVLTGQMGDRIGLDPMEEPF